MKRIFGILLIIIYITGCEDVVDIDTPVTPPRLYIDAVVRLDETSAVTTIQVKAGTTSSFFNEVEPAELTNVSLIGVGYEPTSALDLNIVVFSEVSAGVYEGSKSTNFFISSSELQLFIEHEGQRYLARTQYVPSSPITNLEQGNETLFSGNETEVKVAFVDNGDSNDFYLFDLDFGDYLVTEDEFYQGQTFEFSYFYDDKVKVGSEINISLLGVDEQFYNYMNQLIVQAGGDQGPFQTPSATVRGNIINITNIDNINSFDNVEDSDNFALGYFAVCQTFTETIIIE
ncbi:DUF4249 family protein [Maribacter sp. 2308TA10-17]|uniref:DUF4249 family protein n=1 Tax=Maribacter sp. 2308TA10-17 TaxID=3386276 RepID=UPI0039BCEC15